MESMLQEINTHKAKLLNLINNLINTQLINDEIFINNEIKKESEILNSLFNIKQNFLMNPINPMNLNNNINLNPLMIQPNLIMNPPQMNLNMNQFNSILILNKLMRIIIMIFYKYYSGIVIMIKLQRFFAVELIKYQL